MTDEPRGTEDGVADPEHHLTAEDTGTTSDPADLVDDAGSTNGAAATPAASASDDSVGHVFDQTNGMVDDLDGDSDGTAASDEESSADRHGENEPNPVGQQDAFQDDWYGEQNGTDRNP